MALDAEPDKDAPRLQTLGPGTDPSRYRVGARVEKVKDRNKRHGQARPCYVADDGKVLCVGNNEYGQAGGASSERVRKPAAVAGIDSAVQVVNGRRHACALTSDGTVLCWGNNTYGQLGPDDDHNLGLPGKLRIISSELPGS